MRIGLGAGADAVEEGAQEQAGHRQAGAEGQDRGAQNSHPDPEAEDRRDQERLGCSPAGAAAARRPHQHQEEQEDYK